ncbi:MAG: 3-deoxy-7-phosphoheptulonate synthase [Elusimicrobiota bacterium]
MLIIMEAGCAQELLQAVLRKAADLGFQAAVIPGFQNPILALTGAAGPVDPGVFEAMPGVREALDVSRLHYRLGSRAFKPADSVIDASGVRFGAKEFVVAAGPCAVEDEDQLLRIARGVKAAGARMLRGGAFKPRSSPYSFQGLGTEGLKMLAAVKKETGLPVVTEATDQRMVAAVSEVADVIQIGARNMQNIALLRETARTRRAVLLKRSPNASLDEWLMAAEYILKEGNPNVVLCERGGRTAADPSRSFLCPGMILAAREASHLPVIADPSHGGGRRRWVSSMAKAAAALGAHGLIVEVHDQPERALSDGKQALSLPEFESLMDQLRALAPALGMSL